MLLWLTSFGLLVCLLRQNTATVTNATIPRITTTSIVTRSSTIAIRDFMRRSATAGGRHGTRSGVGRMNIVRTIFTQDKLPANHITIMAVLEG